MLKNENGALPLAEGSGVSRFSAGSVDSVYGGTDSGAADTAAAAAWKGPTPCSMCFPPSSDLRGWPASSGEFAAPGSIRIPIRLP